MEKVVTAGFIEGPGIINSNKENAIFFEGSVMFSVCRIKKNCKMGAIKQIL